FHHRQCSLGKCGEAVGTDVMGDAERFAIDAFQVVSLQCSPGGECDRVDQDVETVPVLGQCGKQRVDLGIVRYIAGQDDIGAELGSEFGDAVLEFFGLV